MSIFVDIFLDEVRKHLHENTQLKNGVILRSNLDVLKAELVKIEQKEIELHAIKQNFVQMLSYFIKKNIDENTQLETPEKFSKNPVRSSNHTN